jgi:lipopolysaccharide transport system permease protein
VSAPTRTLRAPVSVLIRPVGSRLLPDLRELWLNRELIYFFVWRDIKVRYKQTVFGAAWAIVQPFVLMLAFSIFFGRLAGIPTDGIPRPVFYYSALVPWMYFAQAVVSSTNSLVSNRGLITKIYFPRVIFPVSAVLPGLVDLTIALVILVAIAAGFGLMPGIGLLYLAPLIVLAVATALATGLWLSTLNARYRDIGFGVTFLVQLWMFASPVVYPSSLVPDGWRRVYALNPMASVVEGFRWAVAGAGQPPDERVLYSLGVVAIMLLGGLWFFRRNESPVVDLV